MQNSNSNDGTEVPQSTNADVTMSSQTIAKPLVGRSVNQEYADLAFRQQELTNKKQRSIEDESEIKRNADKLTKMELGMSSDEIIKSVRHAFMHIPPRN
ncbi:MAG: hypothetical protein ABI921_00595 [Panacibacter sp.]